MENGTLTFPSHRLRSTARADVRKILANSGPSRACRWRTSRASTCRSSRRTSTSSSASSGSRRRFATDSGKEHGLQGLRPGVRRRHAGLHRARRVRRLPEVRRRPAEGGLRRQPEGHEAADGRLHQADEGGDEVDRRLHQEGEGRRELRQARRDQAGPVQRHHREAGGRQHEARADRTRRATRSTPRTPRSSGTSSRPRSTWPRSTAPRCARCC